MRSKIRCNGESCKVLKFWMQLNKAQGQSNRIIRDTIQNNSMLYFQVKIFGLLCFPLPLKKRKNEDANSSMSFTGHRSIPVQAHHVVLRLLLLTILLFCTTKSITHNALTKTQCAPLTSTYTCCGRGAGKTTYHTQIRRLKERPSERSENQSATLHACSGYLFHCREQGEVEQW